MADGSTKLVKNLRKNDEIRTQDGKASKLICVIKFKTQRGLAKLCNIGGLSITPRHPIEVEGTWVYPSSISAPQETKCPAVYNLIVESNHIAIINEVPVILMGHNYTDGILKHEYLGSHNIVKDLKVLKG